MATSWSRDRTVTPSHLGCRPMRANRRPYPAGFTIRQEEIFEHGDERIDDCAGA